MYWFEVVSPENKQFVFSEFSLFFFSSYVSSNGIEVRGYGLGIAWLRWGKVKYFLVIDLTASAAMRADAGSYTPQGASQ